MPLQQALKDNSDYIESVIDQLLPQEVRGRIGENRLARAMRYSALAGGKRLRPFLVMQTASLFGVSPESSVQTAVAIECIHTYSLIHDDLPALDDDDIRRGTASCHKEFDEATAILAGDSLLTLAFEMLADESAHPNPAVRAELVAVVARAVGTQGMIGGQMIDMLSEERELNIEQVTRLQRMKTGALFAVSCEVGAILGKASNQAHNALRGYANDLGMAFQITDDLLDAESGQDERMDKSSGKGTFVSVLGVDNARKQATILGKQAEQHLRSFGARADLLCELVDFVINREH